MRFDVSSCFVGKDRIPCVLLDGSVYVTMSRDERFERAHVQACTLCDLLNSVNTPHSTEFPQLDYRIIDSGTVKRLLSSIR